MTDSLRTFLKSTGVYLVGTVMTKAIWLILVPLYSHVVSPADYGTYDLNVTMVTLLSSVVYLEIWNAVLRFMFDHEDSHSKAKPVASGMALFGLSTGIFALSLFIFNWISPVEHVGYVFLYGLCVNIFTMSGYIARGYKKSFVFMLSGVISALLTVVLNLLFLLVLGMGYQAMYLSFAIGQLVGALINIIGSGLLVSMCGTRPTRSLSAEMTRYAFPLAVNSIAYWFLTSYNRLAITRILGASDNGLYAMAGKFGIMITLVTQAFQLAWAELSFSRADEDRSALGTFFSRSMNEYIRFMALGVMILLPAVYLVWPLFVGAQYAEAISLVPLYMAATQASVYCSFMTSMFATIKDTRSILLTTLAGSVVNVVCVHALLPVMGLQGANLALLIGFVIDMIFRMILLYRQARLKVSLRRALVAVAGVSVMILLFCFGGVIGNAVGLLVVVTIATAIYWTQLKQVLGKK